ncbi:MAG: RluA family pseudouridine synthase [Oscillospiraceae bacterium]|nr:RluA family pseudouridine synthase [Oscillospiraceae bacterium]
MDFVIKSDYDKKTVKDFLKSNINISRNMLIVLKNKSDGITVNGNRVTVRFVLSEGDVLSLNHENIDELNQDKSFVAENQSLLNLLNIVYEDDFIIAVNKPPNMPSHPSINHFDDTLANLVVTYFRNNNIKSFYRAVNRLDKNTSGIVLVAKDKIMSARLNDMMKRGEIKKTYIAVLNGNIENLPADEHSSSLREIGGVYEYNPENKTGRIIAPIRREHASIIKRVCAVDGDYAETEFKVLKYNNKASVLEVYPKTGRTHQIRLHFCAIGLPLLGEDLYCENNINQDYIIKRHALHAYCLEFNHPENNKKINISCELPEDMSGIINRV